MDDALKVAAQGLLQLGKLWPRGTVTDVYCWSEEHRDRFAFTGDGEKISRYWMDDEHPALSGPAIDRALTAVFGLKSKRTAGGYATIFGDERHLSMSDFFDRLSGSVLFDVVPEQKRDGFSVGMMPEPGYPWPVEGEYYSAVHDEMRSSDRPAWLTEITDRDVVEQAHARAGGAVYGVNPCVVFPSDETKCQRRELLARFSKGGSFMVAHSMGFRKTDYKSLAYAIDGIKSCGGLLFPSLSVGEIPASNFGHVSLIAPVDLVIASLRPYRARGRLPCWVYDGDAWTVTAGEMMKSVAVRLFDELHGNEDWIYGSHMWTIGPPQTIGSDDFRGEPVDTMAQLSRVVRDRVKHWSRKQTMKQLDKTWQKIQATKHQYGYSEAKAREVVDINEFPLLVAPKHLAAEVEKFVAGVGYEQQVELVDASDLRLGDDEPEEVKRWAEVQWAWRVRDEVEAQSGAIEVVG